MEKGSITTLPGVQKEVPMLDRLPREIVDIILHDLDPDLDRLERPAYTFVHRSRVVYPLSLVSRGWRNAVFSITSLHLSLVRDYENQRLYDGSMGTTLRRQFADNQLINMSQSLSAVQELEIPSDIEALNYKSFQRVKALTILGPTTKIHQPIELPRLEYLAASISTTPLELISTSKLRRLDLLLDSDVSCEALKSLESPSIVELNIMNRGVSSSFTMASLVTFISHLPNLRKLSLRKKLSKVSSHVSCEQSPIDLFFDVIQSRHSLEEFAIDMSYLRTATLSEFFKSRMKSLDLADTRPSLMVTLVEPALAGQWTEQEMSTILNFLSCLSSTHDVTELKMIYGIQTEIPTQTTSSGFVQLLTQIHNDYPHLNNLKTFSAMMAWNILDDAQLYLQQQRNPFSILSYETDSTFSPNYRKCIKFKKWGTNPNGIMIVKTEESLDLDFWSRETVLQHLFRYCEVRPGSSLWD